MIVHAAPFADCFGRRGMVKPYCWDGRSRSAAVAEAVWEFRGRKDELRTGRDVLPNPRVYALARGELGKGKNDPQDTEYSQKSGR